eukprot:TRINITY_DN2188_c0_g1::TRINITY_DN2188_c0_g1_i1::g.12829::m.12829 TRINITY_DN2188_c0_g1::TRINITY_DN2188_c0_g1_i1::g.12829  ORF type:complete len:353 (+),score=8.88,sp/B1H1W9/KTU_XENLA/31.01/4e-44,PIH1/PF08190.7/6.5e+03,PIH1/PF08190.7/2.9e-57,CS/PF04969.11/0.16,ASXH/PF13919.1/1.6 TRINITY_DN2188_c0_g1_i1:94-1152(+)
MQLTQQEQDRFKQCFEDEKFRELFFDFAKELADPKYKEEYEQYFKQLEEEERNGEQPIGQVPGSICVPKPGFCVKTYSESNKKKAYVNFCHSDRVEEGTAVPGEGGASWDLPYILGKAREERDKHGNGCLAYDITFNTKTLDLFRENRHKEEFLVQTGFDALEQHRSDCVQRGYKVISVPYFGANGPAIVSTASAKAQPQRPSQPEPRQARVPSPVKAADATSSKIASPKYTTESGPETPEYEIVHQGSVDIQDFVLSRYSTKSTRPQNLILRISLLKLETISGVDLDISTKTLTLDAPGQYHLHVDLPFEVDEENGSAKFDKSKRKLVITLPVVGTLEPKVISNQSNDNKQ